MKRFNNVIEEVITDENLNKAFDYVISGIKRKSCKEGKWLINNRESVISKIKWEIRSGTYKITKWKEFDIKEYGKARHIKYTSLYDTIVLHALMTVVEKYLNRRIIVDSAAAIKGRGMHYLFLRMYKDMQKHPNETRFCYKADIKKFYESIPQDNLYWVFTQYFKDRVLLTIMYNIIHILPQGIPIGIRSSQVLGNMYINYYIGRILKYQGRYKFIRIYCDDIVVQAESYSALEKAIKLIHEGAEKAGLQIKSNEKKFDIKKTPIDFLGYVVDWNGKIKIRKRIKQKIFRQLSNIKSNKRKCEIISSFYGMSKYANACNLFKLMTKIPIRYFRICGIQALNKFGN